MRKSTASFVPHHRFDPAFAVQRRVAWIDVDQHGCVQFPNYLRYAEETEYAFLRSRGVSPIRGEAAGILGFPRVQASLELVRPLRWDEVVQVAISSLAHDGKQVEYSFQLRAADEPSARICFRVACCRFPGAASPYAIPLPDEFLARIFGGD